MTYRAEVAEGHARDAARLAAALCAEVRLRKKLEAECAILRAENAPLRERTHNPYGGLLP